MENDLDQPSTSMIMVWISNDTSPNNKLKGITENEPDICHYQKKR
jgi:hypothetical protein